jgi:hypothetical protein
LAAGARKCVYCAHGTQYRPKEQLAIPAGTVPEHRNSIAWGRWFLVLLAVAAALVWFTPSLHAKIQPLLDKMKSLF